MNRFSAMFPTSQPMRQTHGVSTSLLVSVRSAPEARAALVGGADVIDVKEPNRGSLGRADDETILSVMTKIGAQRPLSAAMGELLEGHPLPEMSGLRFLKWGLAGCGNDSGWRQRLAERGKRARALLDCEPVAVAYADAELARAPAWPEIVTFAEEHAWRVVLIDTCTKDGRTLLDWLPLRTIEELCRRCRHSGIRIALAGSLGASHIGRLLQFGPDWFAVRGAVCHGRLRSSEVDPEAIGTLLKVIRRRPPAFSGAG